MILGREIKFFGTMYLIKFNDFYSFTPPPHTHFSECVDFCLCAKFILQLCYMYSIHLRQNNSKLKGQETLKVKI